MTNEPITYYCWSIVILFYSTFLREFLRPKPLFFSVKISRIMFSQNQQQEAVEVVAQTWSLIPWALDQSVVILLTIVFSAISQLASWALKHQAAPTMSQASMRTHKHLSSKLMMQMDVEMKNFWSSTSLLHIMWQGCAKLIRHVLVPTCHLKEDMKLKSLGSHPWNHLVRHLQTARTGPIRYVKLLLMGRKGVFALQTQNGIAGVWIVLKVSLLILCQTIT